MSDIVIVSAARTAVGSFNGALSSLPAHELGKVAILAALERAGVPAADVDEVIMGQVLQAGAGQGPARQAAINAGLPVETPAWSLNTDRRAGNEGRSQARRRRGRAREGSGGRAPALSLGTAEKSLLLSDNVKTRHQASENICCVPRPRPARRQSPGMQR